jgi:hypothetical protein
MNLCFLKFRYFQWTQMFQKNQSSQKYHYFQWTQQYLNSRMYHWFRLTLRFQTCPRNQPHPRRHLLRRRQLLHILPN